MTLQELFDYGITIEGSIKVQRWDNDNEPTVLFEGYADECPFDNYKENVSYMFAVHDGYEAVICFELENE